MARKLSPDAERFVKRVESMLKKAGYTGGLEAQACRMLTCDDLKVVAVVWKTLMGYKYGLPKESREIFGKIEHALTAEDRKSAEQAIQKLLPPAEQTIEVSGKELN